MGRFITMARRPPCRIFRCRERTSMACFIYGKCSRTIKMPPPLGVQTAKHPMIDFRRCSRLLEDDFSHYAKKEQTLENRLGQRSAGKGKSRNRHAAGRNGAAIGKPRTFDLASSPVRACSKGKASATSRSIAASQGSRCCSRHYLGHTYTHDLGRIVEIWLDERSRELSHRCSSVTGTSPQPATLASEAWPAGSTPSTTRHRS